MILDCRTGHTIISVPRSMHDPLVFLPGIRKKVRLMELLEYEKAPDLGSPFFPVRTGW